MSLSQKLEASEDNTPHGLGEDIPMNPFAPTQGQVIVLIIGLLFALDRRGIIRILPFHIGLLGGIIPAECLLWTAVIADMARKDIVQIWRNIRDTPSDYGGGRRMDHE